jgi:hypothetical protein
MGDQPEALRFGSVSRRVKGVGDRAEVAGAWIPAWLACLCIAGCAADGPAIARHAAFDTVAAVSFDGLPVPGAGSSVAVNQDGTRIAVAPRDGSGEVMLFDGQGGWIRTFGRHGGGPGEYGEISALTFSLASDTLWILDEENGRISVVPPDATEPARMISLNGRFFGVAWASNSVLMVQGHFPGDGRAVLAQAVHNGGTTPVRLGRSWESGVDSDPLIRPMTSAAGGGIWMGHFRRPELRRLDSALSEIEEFAYRGSPLGLVPRNAEKWRDYVDSESAVLAITEDGQGDLWVLFGVPADPLPDVDDAGRALAEGKIGVEDLAHTVLTRYERDALDGGSEPIDQFVQGILQGGLLPGGFAYSFHPDENGEVTLFIVRLGSGGT